MLLLISLFLISNPLHAATIVPTPQNTCEVDEYLCEGGTVCIPIPWMCDGHQDCPNSEDEEFDVCGVPCYTTTTTTTTTTVPVLPISCGQSYQDIASYSGSMTFSFTLPASYSMLKISTCHTENGGVGTFSLCPTSDPYNCVYSEVDASCGCSGRPLILATVGDAISADTEYTLRYDTFFSGTYKFTVECGSSFAGGGNCVPDTTSTYDPDNYYGYYGYPDPANPSSTDPAGGSQQSTRSTHDNGYYYYPNPPNPSSTDSGSQSNTYDYYGYYQQTNDNGNPGVTTTRSTTDEPTCDPTMGPTPPTASPVPSSPPVKRPTNPSQDTDDLTTTLTHIGGGRNSASAGLKPNSAMYAVSFLIVIYKIFY